MYKYVHPRYRQVKTQICPLSFQYVSDKEGEIGVLSLPSWSTLSTHTLINLGSQRVSDLSKLTELINNRKKMKALGF